MTDIIIQENREDRYGKTERKNLTLTSEVIEVVQAYADRHGLYFSVAVESLVLLGLKQAPAETLPRLVANTLNRQFNRFAKLIATTAISAEEVNYKTDVLLLQTIWREARQDPEHFAENIGIRDDPGKQPDTLARQIQENLCATAHDEAVARLKKPMGSMSAILKMEETDESATDQ